MPLKSRVRLALDFKSVVAQPKEIRWAVERVKQRRDEWCWAASLSNTLAAYGREISQKQLVDGFYARHPEIRPRRGAALAQEYWLPFYRNWFPRASWLSRNAPFEEVKEALHESPLIGILESSGGDHLVVICGLRGTAARSELLVSDSFWPQRNWVRWEELRDGTSDGQPVDDPWTETIALGQTGFAEHVFRFVPHVADLEAVRIAPRARSRVDPPPNRKSQLTFGLIKGRFSLAKELSLSLLGYLFFLEKLHPTEIEYSTYLHESIRLWTWRPPYDDNKSTFGEHFSRIGWHHQLFDQDGTPRQYAQTFRKWGDWRTRWVGLSRVTLGIDRSIVWLDDIAQQEAEVVELVWLQLGREEYVHLLWLKPSDRFLVAWTGGEFSRRVWEIGERRLLEAEEVLDRMRASGRAPTPPE